MKMYGLKKYLLIPLAVFLIIQTSGCCKKKVKITEKKYNPVVIQDSGNSVVPTTNDESDKLMEKTGLNYSISNDYMPAPKPRTVFQPQGISDFERNYLHGVELLEAEKLDEALSVFREILEKYPDSEEASVAQLCIAEIFFRSKNNEGALKVYQEIIKKFPGTQAAMNAAEGIKYLQNFAKYERQYEAPEKQVARERGR